MSVDSIQLNCLLTDSFLFQTVMEYHCYSYKRHDQPPVNVGDWCQDLEKLLSSKTWTVGTDIDLGLLSTSAE